MAECDCEKKTMINKNLLPHDIECDMFSEPSACPECGYIDLFEEEHGTKYKCRDCGCEWIIQEDGQKKIILHGNLCC